MSWDEEAFKRWLRRWGGAAFSIVVLVVGGLLLRPRHAPALRHTSVVNAVFDSRWMIGAVRLVGAAVVVYALASIAARIGRGQWLKRVGPLDTETPVQDVATDQRRLQQDLDSANETIKELRAELAEALAFIDKLVNTDEPGAEGGAGGEGTPHDDLNEGGGP